VERGGKYGDQTATVGGANKKKYQSLFIKTIHMDESEKNLSHVEMENGC